MDGITAKTRIHFSLYKSFSFKLWSLSDFRWCFCRTFFFILWSNMITGVIWKILKFTYCLSTLPAHVVGFTYPLWWPKILVHFLLVHFRWIFKKCFNILRVFLMFLKRILCFLTVNKTFLTTVKANKAFKMKNKHFTFTLTHHTFFYV